VCDHVEASLILAASARTFRKVEDEARARSLELICKGA
jgi:hypothetical protein